MKTSELFEKEIGYISNETIRKIVADTLDMSPDCIQTIPAASSGKYHPSTSLGEGGLVRHIKSTVGIAKCMIDTDIFTNMIMGTDAKENLNYYEDKEIFSDVAIASLILHDCCKPDDTPRHGTRFDHPLLAANLFKNVSRRYVNFDNMEYMKKVIPMIHRCIASHMGEWNTAPYAKGVILPKPKSNIEQFVHMCDYISSRRFVDFNFEKYNEGRW